MKEFDLTQAETFQAIINSFEMAKAKNLITDRAKEIEVFQSTVNNLTSMFISSLAINQTSEERIRESLSAELNTKDKLISNLQIVCLRNVGNILKGRLLRKFIRCLPVIPGSFK